MALRLGGAVTHRRFRRRLLRMVVGVVLLLSACTYVPFDAPKSVSQADNLPSTGALHHIAAVLQQTTGDQDAIFPLADGNDALAARLQMIDQADRTLDLQSFLIKPDQAGALISQALLKAAERGVRVRILLDDAFFGPDYNQIALIDSHANAEVRIFNPLSRNSLKTVNFLFDFARLNRRMHNKSFIADNSLAIIGGRNIADEYFLTDRTVEFTDFELFLAGAAVQDIAATFDLFWNDAYAVPLRALNRRLSQAALHIARLNLQSRADRAASGIFNRAVNADYLRDVHRGRIKPGSGYVQVVSDSPEKLRRPVAGAEKRVAESLFQAMLIAQEEVTVVTPYFVPQDYGARFFQDLAAKGIRVRIVTNSLASTNHPYAHGGYYRHRKALLAAGVELYEIRADAPVVLGQVPVGSPVKLTMHTKAIFIDRARFFAGSLNFDPRSINLNSELGVFVDDPKTTAQLIREIDERLRDYAFSLRLTPQNRIEWLYQGGGLNEVYVVEPKAGLVANLLSITARFLPIEGLL